MNIITIGSYTCQFFVKVISNLVFFVSFRTRKKKAKSQGLKKFRHIELATGGDFYPNDFERMYLNKYTKGSYG